MTKKKKTTRKRTVKKNITKRKSTKKNTPRKTVEKSPEYMIQISDPKMLRKDVLESLREVIIFMQGYEKFRKIQEEKVSLFSLLKTSVRELNSLIDNKLKSYFPKGNLRVLTERPKPRGMVEDEVEIVTTEEIREEETVVHKKDDLAELESQLNSIESQLKRIQ